MAVRAELSADPEAGAGHGRLRITGLPVSSGPLHFSLCSNQGTTPFLGPDGRWQAAETWHEAGEATAADGGEATMPLGPAIIDRIVEQPSTVTYRLTVAIGASSHLTSLRLIRPLFGSGAAAADPSLAERQRQEEEARRLREEEERRRLEAEAAERRLEEAERARLLAEAEERRQSVEEQVPLQEAEPAMEQRRSRWPLLVVGALVLLIAAAGAGAWYGCVVPGFGPARCQGAATPAPPPPLAALPQTCTGLDAAACYQAGLQTLQQNKLEAARQLLQQASGLGSAEASLAVARMYDPDTWSAASSPVARSDWETAVFWYEKAAAQGNTEARVIAGKLLCTNATMDLERTQGRSYLEQAASAGSEQARRLLATCP